MEKNPTEVKPNSSEMTENLWEYFEKTGSIQAFLSYRQKADIRKEADETQSPT